MTAGHRPPRTHPAPARVRGAGSPGSGGRRAGAGAAARARLLVFVLLGLILASVPVPPAGAQVLPAEPPPDLSPEVFRIARGLRCPVCQGESAAESNSGVAREMRQLIAGMLREGKSEAEIRQFFVDRYGDWILNEPPRRGPALVVWLAPAAGLALLGYLLGSYLRRSAAAAEAGVSEEDLERVERELQDGGPPR